MKAKMISTEKNKHFYEVFLLMLMLSFLLNNAVFAQYKNTATATAGAPGGIQVLDISNNGSTLNQPSGVQTPINFPMIGLGKTASTPILQSNGTYNVDYTFTLKNFGQLALQNVQVADVLSNTFASPVTYTIRAAITVSGGTGLTLNTSFTGTNLNQNLLVSASSTLAVGESRTITVPLNISLNGAIGTFNNSATITANTADNTAVFDASNNSLNPDGNGDGNPMNDSAPTPILFLSPDIQVLNAVSNATPAAGTNITFTITAKNNGPGDAQNVTVNDLLSAGYAYVSSAATAGTYNPTTGSWLTGNIANGINQTLTITAKVLYSKPLSAYQNTVTSNYSGDNTPSNNSQTVTVTPVQAPPDAVNDAITGIAATANATLNILANDVLADGSAATTSSVSVDIDPAVSGIQTTRNVNGQGSWSYNQTSGNITFTPIAGFTLSPTPINYILTETATGLSDQATITVTKAANTDVTLSNLIINGGILTPAFTPSNPNYSVLVANAITSVNVTATANDSNAGISINNTTNTNGSATASIGLNVGSNIISVVIVAHDGVTRQTYTVNVTREKAAQSITFNSLPVRTFGDADFTLLASSNNTIIPVTIVSDNPAVATIANGTVHIIGTGTVNFTAAQAGNANYLAAADVIRTLTVNPASQTISFNIPASKIYGDAAFTLAATASSGLPVSFSSADAGTASVSGNTVTIHKAGTVVLMASQSGNANYQAAGGVNQTLIINPKTLIASLVGNVNKVYDGNTNAAFTTSNFALSGKIGSDDVALNAPSTGNYDNVNAGSGKQTGATGLNLTGSNAANYALASASVSGNIGTIAPAALQISLTGSITKIYDGNTQATLTPANYQLNGLIANDQIDFNKPVSGTYDNSNTGNNKTVSVSGIVLSGADAGNYAFPAAAVGANIGRINPKTLIISADNQTRIYNTTNPVLTIAYDGFVNGETAAGLAAQPTISTTATTASPAGIYPITVSGAAGSNYNFTYVNGALTVGQGSNSIAFNSIPTKIYGDADFMLNATASSGLNVNYTSSNPTVARVDQTGNVHILSAGNTTITASQPGNNNYTAAVAAVQILTVNKALLTVTADDKLRNYGLANPAFTAIYSGFVNGEMASVLSTQPTISTTATATSPAGNYPITANGATAENYLISYASGTLTIKQTALNSLRLAAENVYENQQTGTLAGTLTAVSADPDAVFTYAFSGSAVDHASFRISGNQLFTAASFDYEAKNSYSVTVRATDAHGLYLDQTFSIQINDVNEAPTLSSVNNQIQCFSASTQNLQLNGISAGPESNQTVTLSVKADNPALFSQLQISSAANGKATLTYQMAAAGTAKITVTVQDNGGTANGGTDRFSETFAVTANAVPSAVILAEKTTISKGEIITLKASGGSSYRWDDSAGIISSLTAAEIQIRPAQTTTYQVLVDNASGCSSTASVVIEVADDYAMLKPANLLSPNGDGKNDTWVVKNIDLYPQNTVTIFDKGGRQLLNVKHYQNDWDGTFQGLPLTEGTYYYVIDFGLGKAPIKGFFTILRSR